MYLMRYYRRSLESFLYDHSGPVLLLSALFVIGVIFGALAVRSLDARDRLDLVNYLNGTARQFSGLSPHSGLVLLKRSLIQRLEIIALFWVLGISLVGVLGVMVLALLRGALSGFVVGFLSAEMGARGVALAVAGHLPQSLLEVPAMLIAGTASVAFSLRIIRSWRERRRVPNFYPALAAYTGTLLAMGGVLVLASLVESFLSPELVKLTASFIHWA